MATITLNNNFDSLLEDLEQTQLPDFTLDYMSALANFSLDDASIHSSPVLDSSGLTVQTKSIDPNDSTLYEFRISGSGITPSSNLEQLEAAIEAGTANGTITQISVDYGSQRVAQFDIAPEKLTFTSGEQSLELTGGFPVTLSQMINLVGIIDGEIEGSLDNYGFTGLTLRDGGNVLASLQVGESLKLELAGYTLTLDDIDISVEDIFNFISPGRDQLALSLALFDANGQPVTTGVTNEEYPWGDAQLNFEVPQGGGTFYVQVAAVVDGVSGAQGRAGFYELQSFDGANFGGSIAEDQGDAPDTVATQYSLTPGGSFFGRIDFDGDVDWIRVEIGDSSTGSVSFDALSFGAFEPQLGDLQGFSFSGLTFTAPDGTEILRAENVTSWESFLVALDQALSPFSFPSLADLELAFASGDPHLLTLDGLGYDFHAAGEYVLTRATNGSTFEVQARMMPAGEDVTANTAAAVQLDGGKVMINAQSAAPVTLDGAALVIADASMVEVGQDRIYRDGDTYILVHTRDGSMDTGYSAVVVTLVGTRVDIGVALEGFWMDQVEGLLGNFDGNPDNDLVLANGTPINTPLVFGDDLDAGIFGVYGQFREDWRVTEDNTLFSYKAGEGPDSFYLPDYPTRMITLDDFELQDRSAAEAQAEAAGLTPGSFAFNNAVLDLLLTGDESYLDSAVTVNSAVVERNNGNANAVSTPEVAGGGLEGLLTLSGQLTTISGADLTGATVTFRPTGRSVNLTRLTRDSNEFGFDLSENAAGKLEATRSYDAASDPSITALDALDVLRMAVGLTPSFGEAKAQNFIAADINNDGEVTALDALEVLRAAVGLQSASAPRWVFFDAATDFDAMALSRTNTMVETGIDIAALSANTAGIDMVGILLGNMDQVA